MKFQAILDQVKREGRVKDDGTFDAQIVEVINELFKDAVQTEEPFELFRRASLPLSVGIATMPDDFLFHHRVQFEDYGTGKIWQLNDAEMPSLAPQGLWGHPKSMRATSNFILVNPLNAIVAEDRLTVEYYAKPPVLILGNEGNMDTENTIPRLEPFLIKAAIVRVRMFHTDDIKAAEMLQQQLGISAKAFANDTPQATEQP